MAVAMSSVEGKEGMVEVRGENGRFPDAFLHRGIQNIHAVPTPAGDPYMERAFRVSVLSDDETNIGIAIFN